MRVFFFSGKLANCYKSDTDIVTAVVSVDDANIFLQEYSLQSILDFINES